ncbi:MAG TPA: glycosyltransferase family 4 protein [Bdellovibrionota bacterium]|nr:glycosyltransferase family 4 protein [Bdellovibrionota bacterium]
MILSSCINGGGAGRSLTAYLDREATKIHPIVVLPEAGVIAEKLTHGEEIHYVPEFIERIQRSPYRLPRWLNFAWMDITLGVVAILKSMWKIRSLARRLQPDVIYCNHMLAKPIGSFVGSSLHIPVVFHARNVHEHWVGRAFYQFLARRASTRRIICNSRASAAPYSVGSREKVRVVPNFVELSQFERGKITPRLRQEFHLKPDALVVGYLGRILSMKGIDVLLEAFSRVHTAFPQALLALVGDNDGGLHRNMKADYERRARDLGIAEQTLFVGFRADIRPYVVDFDILTMPSIEPESFGRVLIEAMALGIPPIVSAHGGAIEIVQHGLNGLWALPGDREELSIRLKELLSNPILRQRLGRRAAEDVRANFGAEKNAARITELLREVVQRDIRHALDEATTLSRLSRRALG